MTGETCALPISEAAETALGQLLSLSGPPEPALQAAEAADPGWIWPALVRAGDRLLQTQGLVDDTVQAALAAASERAQRATPQEQLHLQAVRALADGRTQAACLLWEDLLLEHPHDALALLWAQAWDLRRGDLVQLVARPAQVLPDWAPDDPLYPHLLGLYAFGLQETLQHALAEDVARRALARHPRNPRAVLALAHVMECQGRCEDGTAWLRQQQEGWADGGRLEVHLWWHMGLFRLEAMDLPGVHRLLDAHLSGAVLRADADHHDAVGLLWRMHLLGDDVGARFTQLLRGWQADDGEAGAAAFHDLHVLLALLGADELLRAERWIARCAARAMQAEDARQIGRAHV